MSVVGENRGQRENRGQTDLSQTTELEPVDADRGVDRFVCPRFSWPWAGQACRQFGRLLLALLREIADEGAYRRHLAALGQADSPAEWRRFSERRLLSKYARPKCC